jgi:hypothetical protein
MRALVLATFLALAAASSDAGGDACPASPPSPGDRRRSRRALTFASHDAGWFLDEAIDRPSGSPDARDHEDASARLQRIAADVVSLDADVVHVFGLDGCGSLRKLAAACTSADPSVSTDWRPYLLAPGPNHVPADGQPEDEPSDADTTTTTTPSRDDRRLGALTRVDPVESLRVSPGADSDPSVPAHHVAEIVVGRVPVAVFAVASSRRRGRASDLNPKPNINALAADVRARVAAGEQVVVVGVGVDGRDAARRIADATSSPSSPSSLVSLADDAAWATEGIVAAIDRAESKATSAGDRLELRFRPGRYTNEEETWREYWTFARTSQVAWEAACAVVFSAGVYRLIWPGAYESRPNLVGDFFGYGSGYPAFHARGERQREELRERLARLRPRDGKKQR